MAYTVKQARKLSGLTQQQMADVLCVHRSTYIKLEESPDKITIGQAKAISNATGVPVDSILFFVENST